MSLKNARLPKSIRHAINSIQRRFLQNFLEIKGRLLENPTGRLVLYTLDGLGRHDVSDRAGSIAYYAILSLFPLLLGAIAILGLFLPSETVQNAIIAFFQGNLPGAVDVVERNINGIIELRGTLGVLSILGLFWAGGTLFGAIGRVINRVWGISVRQQRPFYKRKLRDLGIAVSTSMLLLLFLGITTVISLLPEAQLPVVGTVANLGSIFLAFSLALTIFLLAYKLIPNTKTHWRYVFPGALLAAILFEIVSNLFVIFLSRFANYELIYGSIASAIVLLIWIYISAFILVLGAQFSCEYSRWRYGQARSCAPRLHQLLEQPGDVQGG